MILKVIVNPLHQNKCHFQNQWLKKISSRWIQIMNIFWNMKPPNTPQLQKRNFHQIEILLRNWLSPYLRFSWSCLLTWFNLSSSSKLFGIIKTCMIYIHNYYSILFLFWWSNLTLFWFCCSYCWKMSS